MGTFQTSRLTAPVQLMKRGSIDQDGTILMRTDFTIGVISSIAATIAIFAVAWAARRWGTELLGLHKTWQLARQLRKSGIAFVFSSRSDYQKFRGTPTQADYFRLAKRRVEMVGQSFQYGQHSQGVSRELSGLLRANPELEITLATLDPNSGLVGPLATYWDGLAGSANSAAARLRSAIVETLESFQIAKDAMPPSLQARFTIKIYSVLPVASVIMLDRNDESGRTQIDIKPFGSPRHHSFAIEVLYGSALYDVTTAAWGKVIDAATTYDPAKRCGSGDDTVSKDSTDG